MKFIGLKHFMRSCWKICSDSSESITTQKLKTLDTQARREAVSMAAPAKRVEAPANENV